MERDPVTTGPEVTVAACRVQMGDRRVLPVVDAASRPVGTVEDVVLWRAPPEQDVATWMTEALVLPQSSTVREAVRVLAADPRTVVLLVDAHGVLVGTLTEAHAVQWAIQRMPPHLKVRQAATRGPLLTLLIGCTVGEARARLEEAGIRHGLVERDGALVGIVTPRDLLQRADTDGVDQAMQREVRTADPMWTLREAAVQLTRHDIGCLPVVSQGELIGILTRTDVLRAMQVYL